jgi:hypothetical protein
MEQHLAIELHMFDESEALVLSSLRVMRDAVCVIDSLLRSRITNHASFNSYTPLLQ